MKAILLRTNQLLPSQWSTRSNALKNLLNFSPEQYHPVPVMRYNENFLLCGGHNRAFLATLLEKYNRCQIDLIALMAECSSEAELIFDGAFKKSALSDLAAGYKKRKNDINMGIEFPLSVPEMRCDITITSSGKDIILRGNEVYAREGDHANKEDYLGNLPSIESFISAQVVPADFRTEYSPIA